MLTIISCCDNCWLHILVTFCVFASFIQWYYREKSAYFIRSRLIRGGEICALLFARWNQTGHRYVTGSPVVKGLTFNISAGKVKEFAWLTVNLVWPNYVCNEETCYIFSYAVVSNWYHKDIIISTWNGVNSKYQTSVFTMKFLIFRKIILDALPITENLGCVVW